MEKQFDRLDEDYDSLEKKFLDTLESQMDGGEIGLLDKAMLFHLQTKGEIEFEYEVGNFIRPLRFFVSNRHDLKFLQEGIPFHPFGRACHLFTPCLKVERGGDGTP